MSLGPIAQKAHDISHAVFRVATLIKNASLRAEIENAAVEVLSKYEDMANLELPFANANVAEKLERLIALAESIGEMKKINAEVLKRELGNLHTAIDFHVHMVNPAKAEAKIGRDTSKDMEIEGMFKLSAELTRLPRSARNDKNTEPRNDNAGEISIRQTAILRSIREMPFCRLRNIVETMPNVSERTIRNDIQGLIEKDLIRRVGGGGPNSYFETMEVAIRSTVSSE